MIPHRFLASVIESSVLALLLLASAPVSAEPPASAPAAAPDTLVDELSAHLHGVPDASRAEGQALAAELAAEWRREAGTGAESESVLAILRADLLPKLQGRSPAERLEVLRGEVYDRRVRGLSVRSFALGRSVVDGAADKAAARAAGEALLVEVKALLPLVRTLKAPEVARVLEGELQEVSLEAVYSVAGGAMSGRLARYAQDKRADAPPTVH